MNDVRHGVERHDQADEWATVAGGLPAHAVPVEWPVDLPVVSPGSGTVPNGGRPASVPVLDVPAELVDHPRYRVEQSLGKGGMGAVYRAEHRVMKRAVALKVIAPHLVSHPEAVERFRREVEAAARLSHPNIVTAYDAEQAGTCHFLVMELVNGVSLNRLIEGNRPFPVENACECVRQTALGLEHAHTHGMVHRDIKPHNLMLTRAGQVKILDFGLTRFAGESSCEAPLTHWSSLTGTPDYMAPEQAQNAHQADIRADIYSLGCTLYYLLAGRTPFVEGGAFEKVLAHMKQEPASLANLRPDLPPELVRVVARMMAKDPERRFQTPLEAARALQAFSKGASLGEWAEDETNASLPQPEVRPTAAPSTRTGPLAPSRGSRTLRIDPGARPLPVPEKALSGDATTALSTQRPEESRPNSSRISSALTVGLVLFGGFGVGGAVGLLNLFRPGAAQGEPDRGKVVARSKLALPGPAPTAAKAPDPGDADDPNPVPIPIPTLPPVPSPERKETTAPPKSLPSVPVRDKKVARPKSTSSASPVSLGRGQVVVRSREANIELAIRRAGIVVLTLRPGMGTKELPVGNYELLVVGGPSSLQGLTTQMAIARGVRVDVDVRPEGIFLGDPSTPLPPPPPPPPPPHPEGPPTGPPPGPRRR